MQLFPELQIYRENYSEYSNITPHRVEEGEANTKATNITLGKHIYLFKLKNRMTVSVLPTTRPGWLADMIKVERNANNCPPFSQFSGRKLCPKIMVLGFSSKVHHCKY